MAEERKVVPTPIMGNPVVVQQVMKGEPRPPRHVDRGIDNLVARRVKATGEDPTTVRQELEAKQHKAQKVSEPEPPKKRRGRPPKNPNNMMTTETFGGQAGTADRQD